ncbi:protein racg [Anaeramoeba flamelloides]|uniref:Protein racg n=1 Tax=Anaeramoeba flamelloides TaxID=1746091 RepID=A0ABQ8X852_9EUKA|nr:protein racg [Anaeramoeba flamelloides]
MSINNHSVKIVVVGDGAVGKTLSLTSYCKNEIPKRYVPTVFDNLTCNVTVDQTPILLTIWDTAGQEEYDQLRPLSYPGTDIFLMMFSTISPTSLENIKYKWFPEIQEHCPNGLCMLVGSKLDLREDNEYLEENNINPVTTEQGTKLAKDLGCCDYFEMSGLTQKNLHNTFEQALRIVLSQKMGETIKFRSITTQKKNTTKKADIDADKKHCCTIL